MTKQRRRHKRLSHPILAKLDYIERSGKTLLISGKVSDISMSGLAISVPAGVCPALSLRLPVYLTLTRTADRLDWTGYVARLNLFQDGSTLIGIEYDSPRHDALTNLESHQEVAVRVGEDANVLHYYGPRSSAPSPISDQIAPFAPRVDAHRLFRAILFCVVAMLVVYGLCESILWLYPLIVGKGAR